MKIKAITLWNPWAFLVMLAGNPDPEVAKLGKRFETRSWYTPYRGPLAIHAAKYIPPEAEELCLTKPFQEAFEAAGIKYGGDMPLSRLLPCGAVLAIANMAECCRIGEDGLYRLLPNEPSSWFAPLPSDPERSFGDYRPGRFMLDLQDIKPLSEPIPAKGHQRLWNWEPPEGVCIDGPPSGLLRPGPVHPDREDT